ncbi:MAG: protein kinase family protein [Clostridia bacterium]|nr:protein kinase family protein [Clostridia bacterium]
MAKSLKTFVRESAIKKEVATWKIEDCKEYLDKHKDDNVKPNSLMAKKLNIVKKHQEILKNIESAKKKKGDQREKLLEDVPFDLLIKNAPPEAQDPQNKKLRNYQKNTGVYLWSLGYDVDEFIGAGCSAVVWKCKDGKAMRVACDKKLLGFIKISNSASEIKDSNEIEAILQNNPKNSKYLFSTKHIKDVRKSGKAVFETELAKHGDLQKFQGDNSYKKNIERILQMASDALKGLKALHDSGYSHNDIKPDNILVGEKTKKDGTTRINLKIADFGAMTKINNTYKIFTNKKFHAPDFYKVNEEAVAGRDIYSLGCIFIGLLMDDQTFSNNYQKLAKELGLIGSEKFFDKYLSSVYSDINDKEKNIIIFFLNLIILMTKPSYKNRISINDALFSVKTLKSKI